MSIVVFPPQSGGGSASIADATDTTAGKIRIATSGESTAGTNTVTAMTPALVQAKINAAVSGGVEYKGSFNAATATPSLVTALKGDLYLVSHAGTFAGIALNVNDHIVFNQNAADPVTSSMFDVIDNTSDTSLQKSQNLGDLDNLGQAQTNLGLAAVATSGAASDITGLAAVATSGAASDITGLGTAATKDTGVSNGNVIVADATGLPVIDGSQLTGVTAAASNITGLAAVATSGAASDITGLGTAATKDTGVSNGNVIVADATGLPVIDGSQLTGVVADIILDTSPQLGGNLDVNSNDIISVTNGAINLAPNGSGQVTIKGNATGGAGQLKLNCEQNSHGITIKGPPHTANANYTLTLPNDDGDADQVLKTDGNGLLDWVDQSGGSAPKLNEIATGDAASELKTTVGDITINASANDADIIFQGNDGGSPITMLTLDGSEDGDATFKRDVKLAGDLVLTGSAKSIEFESGEVKITHKNNAGLTIEMGAEEGANEPIIEFKSTFDGSGAALDFLNTGITTGTPLLNRLRARTGTGTTDIRSQIDTLYTQSTGVARLRFFAHDGTTNDNLLMEIDGSDNSVDIKENLIVGSTGGDQTLNIASHDLVDGGLKLAGTLVTASASELNLLDGGTTAASTAITDSDSFILNDGGTMKAILASDVKTYTGANKPGVTSVASGDFSTNNYTIATYTGHEEIFLMSPGAGSTATLPLASTVGSGYKYQIKLLTAHTLTVTRAGTDTIDGQTTFAISAQYSALTILSDGSNWHII